VLVVDASALAVALADDAYVALAEALDVPLLTADTRVGRVPGTTCRIEVLGDVSSFVMSEITLD
jgi:PIN domain nuclease of toxin-antitoxin system